MRYQPINQTKLSDNKTSEISAQELNSILKSCHPDAVIIRSKASMVNINFDTGFLV